MASAVADDVGGAIKGHRIDLAYDSRSEALQFGRQTVKVSSYNQNSLVYNSKIGFY